MNSNWTFTETDKQLVDELGGMVPPEVFDAHAHIYRKADLNITGDNFWNEGPDRVDIGVWEREMKKIFPDSKLQGGLFLSTPAPDCDIRRMNSFLITELESHRGSRGLLQFSMDSDPGEYAELIKTEGIAGFKPYHFSSKKSPTSDSLISDFMPEWVWAMADNQNLVITLHIVRFKALADPDNQKTILSMCRKYSGAKLILAHAGRGFNAFNTVSGIATLTGLNNIWFDMSGICEAESLLAILHEFGPSRLLWGSDFPISQIRGRAVTLGDGFAWLQSGTIDWNNPDLGGKPQPILLGLESLRAFKTASDEFGLNREDVKDIFCNNALNLLKIGERSGRKTQEAYRDAKMKIPGGTQLLSKRPENMAPEQWPPYFTEASGCMVQDLDGKRYIDMTTNGIGSCLLGFKDPDVNRAVRRRVNLGSQSTLNPYDEVRLAEKLCEIHPWASQVRYSRTGGEATTVAIRIARATTDRSVIAICGYHGWHDWYLAANLGESDRLRGHLLPGLSPLGVPRELRGTTLAFTYNNRKELDVIIAENGDNLAAVIMEPARYHDPEEGFLEYVRDAAHRCGALLVFDEITIGWRLHFGGSHLKFGVNPDIAVFAKALGNGYPIAAVIGTDNAMEGAHTSFISSTNWTEGIGPAAALATLDKMEDIDVPEHVAKIGNQVIFYWKQHAASYNLPLVFDGGYPCLAHFHFNHPKREELRTLYTQLMLERGFLGSGTIYPTLAHSEEIVEQYGEAIALVFRDISEILNQGDIEESLKGPVAHSGFKRLL